MKVPLPIPVRFAARAAALGALMSIAAPSLAVADVARDLGDRARIDWSRGVLSAVGAVAGDLRAPSPAVARVGAEREAREVARARLRELAGAIALAGGGTVAEAARKDPQAAQRLERALSRTVDLEVDHSSDGSVVLTAGLPLEAIRLAVQGAPRPPPGGDGEPITAIVVDASKLLDEPALGLALVAGDERYVGPVVYYRDRRAAGRDSRLGAQVARVTAKAAEGGAIEVDDAAAVAAARRSGALVVVITRPKRKGKR